MAVDQNIIKVAQELQALGTLYGEQFQAMKAVVQDMAARDQKKHELFMLEMEAVKVQREAQTDLQSSFQDSITSLMEITQALINIADQMQQQSQSPAGQ